MLNTQGKFRDLDSGMLTQIKAGGKIWVENSDWSPAIPKSLKRKDFKIGFHAKSFDDAFNDLGLWYSQDHWPSDILRDVGYRIDWTEYGKQIEVRLGYRCIKLGEAYFFFELEINED